jgi:hypothetical protein
MPVDCRFLTTVLHNGKLQHACPSFDTSLLLACVLLTFPRR